MIQFTLVDSITKRNLGDIRRHYKMSKDEFISFDSEESESKVYVIVEVINSISQNNDDTEIDRAVLIVEEI